MQTQIKLGYFVFLFSNFLYLDSLCFKLGQVDREEDSARVRPIFEIHRCALPALWYEAQPALSGSAVGPEMRYSPGELLAT